MKLAALAVASMFLPFAIANADHPRRPPPPPGAIDACAKSKSGDACTFAHRDHQVSGTCEQLPDTTTLACRPDRPPPPPPEAVAACEKAKEGDACAFSHGEHQIAGTCARGPDANKPLACRPQRP